MSGQGYNQIGRFTMEGDTDLVWRPEEGEAEQVEIATWMGDIHRARLLTLASLAGRSPWNSGRSFKTSILRANGIQSSP
jgi:hypothetical protein